MSTRPSRIPGRLLPSLGLVCVLGGLGCDGDEDDSGDTLADTGPAPASTSSAETDDDEEIELEDLPPLIDLDVRVTYEGQHVGPVGVGIFAVCPVEGAPVAYRQVTDPVFPVEVTLINVEPGEYCVYAFLDLEPQNPILPGPEDPTGDIGGVMVEVGSAPVVELSIFDPE